MDRKSFGQFAETLAWKYLDNTHRRLLGRNVRYKCGELDLVYEDKVEDGACTLVFVEVRARRKGGMTTGIQSITPQKLQRLRRAAQVFLITYKGPATSMRLECLAWDGESWEHILQAWV